MFTKTKLCFLLVLLAVILFEECCGAKAGAAKAVVSI